jgi:hypothetical protein
VYGQTRSHEKAKKLAADESLSAHFYLFIYLFNYFIVIPIVADAADFQSFQSIVATADVVIDANRASPDLAGAVISGLAQTVKAVRSPLAPKLSFGKHFPLYVWVNY